MKLWYYLSKRFAFLILAIQFLIIHSASSLNLTNEYLNYKCFHNQGVYSSGSKYEDSLNILLRNVRTANYDKAGSISASYGTAPYSVTIMFQCRGDTYGAKCRTCGDTATAGFRRRCPRIKGGIIWYDQCFLLVTEIDERGAMSTNYKNMFSMHNPNNVRGDAKLFTKRVVDFFSELTLKVEKNYKQGSLVIYYAAGEKKLGKNTLYAMVQCVDSTIDCKGCLAWSVIKLFKNGDIKQGGRVLGSNCNVRYELYPFLRS